MALRQKERRGHHLSQETQSSSPNIIRRKENFKKASLALDLPPIQTSVDRLLMHNGTRSPKFTEHSGSSKPQVIIVHCGQHPEEILKFIDTSTLALETHCEVCIVNSENDFRQMRLERIVDLQGKFKIFLKDHIGKLKAAEQKVDSISKEIKITNALLTPIMAKIDYMEKQVQKNVESMFKKLRQNFTRMNPFRSTKNEIETKIEDFSDKLESLNRNEKEGF